MSRHLRWPSIRFRRTSRLEHDTGKKTLTLTILLRQFDQYCRFSVDYFIVLTLMRKLSLLKKYRDNRNYSWLRLFYEWPLWSIGVLPFIPISIKHPRNKLNVYIHCYTIGNVLRCYFRYYHNQLGVLVQDRMTWFSQENYTTGYYSNSLITKNIWKKS